MVDNDADIIHKQPQIIVRLTFRLQSVKVFAQFVINPPIIPKLHTYRASTPQGLMAFYTINEWDRVPAIQKLTTTLRPETTLDPMVVFSHWTGAVSSTPGPYHTTNIHISWL